MKIAAILPARYHSTRFEGKSLVSINGIPMIERVYRQVEKSRKFLDIIVATDDQRIADTVESFGGSAVLTSSNHSSGSERIWEVMESRDFDAAINIQGDEPIISEQLITDLYEQLETGVYDVVTPAYINPSFEDYLSPHVVKVVTGIDDKALYFSRSPIPYLNADKFENFYHHIGLYGYLRRALQQFVQLPPTKLETLERLEQLRFLENNMNIKVIFSHHLSVGVDVPEDVIKVEEILNKQEIS
jgi:3-deoxy-manno-octulosonate cytidylyltransferase (CMP-KDO synthetase)